jgi:hypothetical protein
MIIKCVERWGSNRNAADAVWVPNGDQLHYPNVSTCVTVTLVFQNGLLGGHASQDTPDSNHQPAQNLRDVIGRMISLAGNNNQGTFKKICFIGTANEVDWELDGAKSLITAKFGQPSKDEPVKYSASKVDIVFDTGAETFYIAEHEKPDQTVDRTIELASEWGTYEKYNK